MSGKYGTLLQYLYREPLGFCRYFAGPAWCPWLPPRPESNDHKLKVNWEVFISGTSITQLHFHITPIVWQCCRVSSPSPLFPDFYLYNCPVAGKAAAKRNAMNGFLHQTFNLDKDKKKVSTKNTNTHTFPRKVSSRWATSESSVTREKLKFSATGSFSERQKAKHLKTSNLCR